MPHKGTVGYELRALNNLLMRRMEAFHKTLEAEGATVMHSWIINFLAEHDGQEVFQKDVEAEFSIARSTASSVLHLMEKKGLITRESVERDARLKRIQLTPRARQVKARLDQTIDSLEARLVRGISERELANFLATLRKLRDNVE